MVSEEQEEIKLLSLFCGYGTDNFAIKKLGIPYKLIGYSDIDKYANQCFKQNHCPEDINDKLRLGDCTKIDPYDLRDFDLLTGGFPCQSFSVAGKGLGELDTRGTLFNEIIRIAEVKQPKYMLLENVKGLMTKTHLKTYEKIISELDRIGYNVIQTLNKKGETKAPILNTKDYGIPQNRERVWFICFRKDLDCSSFKLPEKEELKLFLKDILEDEVDEKYYLNNTQVDRIVNSTYNQNKTRIQGQIAQTLCSRDWKDPKCVDVYNKKIKTDGTCITLSDPCHNNLRLLEPKIIQLNNPKHSSDRIYSDNGVSPTLLSCMGMGGGNEPFISTNKIIQLNKSKESHNQQPYMQNRVYDSNGIMPSICSVQPFILRGRPKMPYLPGERTLEYKKYPDVCPTVTQNCSSGDQKNMLVEPFIAASRGRNKENPSDITTEIKTEQHLEPKLDGTTNTISTVQKDNYVIHNCLTEAIGRGGSSSEYLTSLKKVNQSTKNYRIRKLTPKECFRLQGFLNDEVKLDGLSNTQQYKLAGNGQSVNVVEKIFREMFKIGENNERS